MIRDSILLSSRRSRHHLSMAGIYLFKMLPSRGKRRPAVSHELHESLEIIDREVELSEAGSQSLKFFGGGALVLVRKRFQYFRGPPGYPKSFEDWCGLLAVVAGNGTLRKIL